MNYLEKLQETYKDFVPERVLAFNFATTDLSKTANSVWGFAYQSLAGSGDSYFFGNPYEEAVMRDNVAPHNIRHNDNLEDAGAYLKSKLETFDNLYVVTTRAMDWFIPVMQSLQRVSAVWADFNPIVLDIRAVYCTMSKKLNDKEGPIWTKFQRISIPSKFGLFNIARELGIKEPTIGPQPATKASLCAQAADIMLKMPYPEDSELE